MVLSVQKKSENRDPNNNFNSSAVYELNIIVKSNSSFTETS